MSRYLICAGICGGFIIVLTLFNSDNIFWNTTKAMFDTDSDDKTETIKDDTSQYNRTYQMMAQNLCVASIDKD